MDMEESGQFFDQQKNFKNKTLKMHSCKCISDKILCLNSFGLAYQSRNEQDYSTKFTLTVLFFNKTEKKALKIALGHRQIDLAEITNQCILMATSYAGGFIQWLCFSKENQTNEYHKEIKLKNNLSVQMIAASEKIKCVAAILSNFRLYIYSFGGILLYVMPLSLYPVHFQILDKTFSFIFRVTRCDDQLYEKYCFKNLSWSNNCMCNNSQSYFTLPVSDNILWFGLMQVDNIATLITRKGLLFILSDSLSSTWIHIGTFNSKIKRKKSIVFCDQQNLFFLEDACQYHHLNIDQLNLSSMPINVSINSNILLKMTEETYFFDQINRARLNFEKCVDVSNDIYDIHSNDDLFVNLMKMLAISIRIADQGFVIDIFRFFRIPPHIKAAKLFLTKLKSPKFLIELQRIEHEQITTNINSFHSITSSSSLYYKLCLNADLEKPYDGSINSSLNNFYCTSKEVDSTNLTQPKSNTVGFSGYTSKKIKIYKNI